MRVVQLLSALLAVWLLAGCGGRSTLTIENLTPYPVEVAGWYVKGARPFVVEPMSAERRPVEIAGWPYSQDLGFSAKANIPGRSQVQSWSIRMSPPGPYLLRVVLDEGQPMFERVLGERVVRPGGAELRVRRGGGERVDPVPGPGGPP